MLLAEKFLYRLPGDLGAVAYSVIGSIFNHWTCNWSALWGEVDITAPNVWGVEITETKLPVTCCRVRSSVGLKAEVIPGIPRNACRNRA